jgi:hypothetical protein
MGVPQGSEWLVLAVLAVPVAVVAFVVWLAVKNQRRPG